MFDLGGWRASALAALASVALVLGSVTATSAAELEPDPVGPTWTSPAEVDTAPSDPPSTDVPDYEEPGGDFSHIPDPSPIPAAPPADGGESDVSDLADIESVDLSSVPVEQTGEFQQTYDVGDGVKAMEISAEPVNVQEDGEWVPIETAVEAVGPWSWLGISDGGAVERHPLSPEFAGSADSSEVMAVTLDDHRIAFALEGAAASPLIRNAGVGDDAGSSVEYRDVLPDTDLQYQVAPNGVKENLRLAHSPGAQGLTSWSWQVDAGDLTPHKDAEGNIRFHDVDGESVFIIPAPVMYDSSAVADIRTASEKQLFTAVMHVGDRWVISINADRAWLNDAERAYPVFIDPGIFEGANEDTHSYKSNGLSYVDNGIHVGQTNNGGLWRTVVHFPYERLFGSQVLNAKIAVTGFYGDRQSVDPKDGAVHVANCFGYACLGDTLGGLTVSTSGGEVDDIAFKTRLAQWVDQGSSGHYLEFRGDESATEFTYKHFTASLLVYYKSKPFVGTFSPGSPVNGATGVSLTPKLAVESAGTDSMFSMNYRYWISTTSDPRADAAPAYDSNWTSTSNLTVPAVKLQPGRKYYWTYFVADTSNGILGVSTIVKQPTIRSFTTNNVPVTLQSTSSPADKATVVTTRPVLSIAPVTAPGKTVTYFYRIATGGDAKTGAVVASGWIDDTSWTPPANILQDGVTYSWTVLTYDGVSESSTTWVSRFTVNQRIADPGPAPTDSAGPVTVNLANGNAGLSFTSPAIQTSGGPMGMSFAYNSLKTSNAGLRGEYFDASETSGKPAFSSAKLAMVRNDSNVEFEWGTGSPTAADSGAGVKPLIPSDRFLVRWEGYINLPALDSPRQFQLGITGDDGFTLAVDGATLINDWNDGGSRTTWSTTLLGGAASTGPKKITLEFYETVGGANVTLQYRTRNGAAASSAYTVKGDWLTRDLPVLPAGWGGSNVLGGITTTYTKAEVGEGSIKFTDHVGVVHSYTKKSTGGYEPPAGEYGVAALSKSATDATPISLTDDTGITYLFTRSGTLDSAYSATDIKKSTAPVITYDAKGRVEKISDPTTTGRQVDLEYEGDPDCVIPSGTVAPPDDMLCRIRYRAPGETLGETRLGYDSGGNLVRIINPGDETIAFAYDSLHRVTQIRTPLVMDWLAEDTTRNGSDPRTAILVAYGSTGKVTSVTLPAPNGSTAARPKKSYSYDSAPGTTTSVTVDGFGAAGVPARTVTFNATYLVTSDVSVGGFTTLAEWNAKDQQLSSTDSRGYKTTTIYDKHDRPTDAYGPAEASCFLADRTPKAACPDMPATETSYDEGLKGLNVSYWQNQSMAGKPVGYSLGLKDASSGAFARNYGTDEPHANVDPSEPWSMRGTGQIEFSQAGRFRFNVWADDAVRLYVDDVLLIDNWTNHGAQWAGDWKYWPIDPSKQVQAGDTARIRIEYGQSTGAAEAQLNWWLPGSASHQVVPGNWLTPDYGLPTTSNTIDAVPSSSGLPSDAVSTQTVQTVYAQPWLGLATESKVVLGGTSLTTTTSYDTAANGYRVLGSVPPGSAGESTSTHGTLNTYYTAATAEARCGVPAGTAQYGLLKSTRNGKTNADIGVTAAITTQNVYDKWGRVVGSSMTGDQDWSCVAYDARGRVTRAVDRTLAVEAETDSTFTALTTTVTDAAGSLTTTVDLLGRTTTATDTYGTTTTTTYDQAGRTTSVTVSTTVGGATQTATTGYVYDPTLGRLTSVTDAANGGPAKTMAVLGYNANVTATGAGQLESITYPTGSSTDGGNGTAAALTYDTKYGQQTGLTWDLAGTATYKDAVTRSKSGRIIRDVIQDGATSYTSAYSFDQAGRLVEASIPGHTYEYQFGARTATTCPTGDLDAGKNGNRSLFTDTPTGGNGLYYSTAYCYDSSDRLLSANEGVHDAAAAPAALVRPSNALPAGSITYDKHGNVTKLGNQTFTYDAADRHASTTVLDGPGSTAGTKVTYSRDATGAVVSRTEKPVGGTTTLIRYTGPYVLTGTNSADLVAAQRTLSLPGGVTVSIPLTGTTGRSWSYPNIHGDNTWTANDAGTRTGVYLYDPFGQPLDPVTKMVGSATSNNAIPNTMPGEFDAAWVGSKGKGYEHLGSIAIIEMGVRMYSALLGRFLSPDPVAGGNTSWYNYPNDPINMYDLTGRIQDCGACFHGRYVTSYENARGKTITVLSSVPSSVYTPSRFRNGSFTPVSEAHRLAAARVAIQWSSSISTGAGLLALAASFVAPAFVPALAAISVVASSFAAASTCFSGAGSSDDCATSVLMLGATAVGGIAIGALAKQINPDIQPGMMAVVTGGFSFGAVDLGITVRGWFGE